jgi:hypothetical protein
MKKPEIDSKTEERVMRSSCEADSANSALGGSPSKQSRLLHSNLNREEAYGIKY